MEQRLNVHLFRVTNTGVVLTEQGQVYLSEVSAALDQISLATEELSEIPEGVVTLTTETTLAQKWLIPRLGQLRSRHPGIDLRVSTDTKLHNIDAHDFDIGLRFLRSDPPPGHERVFPCLVRAFTAPDSDPRKVDGSIDLAALAKGNLIQEATFQLWPEWFRASGLDPVPDLDLPHPLNAVLTIQSAVAGLGYALMDENLCEPEQQNGSLCPLNDIKLPFGGYYLAMNSRAGRRKAVRAVRQWLLDQYSGDMPDNGQ